MWALGFACWLGRTSFRPRSMARSSRIITGAVWFHAGSCDRLEALREADAIVREGKRAYDWPCIIRCINTVDVMTAEVPSSTGRCSSASRPASRPRPRHLPRLLRPDPEARRHGRVGIAGTGFWTRVLVLPSIARYCFGIAAGQSHQRHCGLSKEVINGRLNSSIRFGNNKKQRVALLRHRERRAL